MRALLNTLLIIVFKWKMHLLITVLASSFASIIITSEWIIKPKYLAVATIYPSNITPYSNENETDQMLQWLNSKDVRDNVIRSLKLDKYYGVDSAFEYYSSTMSYLYEKNIKFRKTRLECIEISVLDWDKDFAKRILYSILTASNDKIRSIHAAKYSEVVSSYKAFLQVKNSEVDSVKKNAASLSTMHGIYSLDKQSDEITKAVLQTINGSTSNLNHNDIQRLKFGVESYGADLLYLKYRIVGLAKEYSRINNKYDQAVFESNKIYTYINVVSPPSAGDFPVYPKKFVIFIYCILSSIFFTLLIIFIIEHIESFKS